jgi:hypothetical protein
MFLWYIGMSVLLVANVFKSVGLDYRLIAIGSLLPLVVDIPFGHRAFGHSLLFAVVALVVVMAWPFHGSRLARRRWLCLPIGIFAGLVLSGAWMDRQVFWWPLDGTSFGDVALLIFPALQLEGPITIDHILHFSEVLALENSVELPKQAWECVQCAIEKAVLDLNEMRRREGVEISADLTNRLEILDRSLNEIEARSAALRDVSFLSTCGVSYIRASR